jgi:hypothetical protein
MQTLNIPSGVSTIGSTIDVDKNISDLNTTGLISMKTLNNSVWTSWTYGTPEMFQGFLELKRGVGYVINTSADKELILDGPPLNVNNMTYGPGLSMLAIPFDNKLIGDGYIPRLKLNSMKTIDVSIWKSWTAGTPEQFQGFTTTNKNKGYVVNIGQVYDSYLNSDLQDLSEGIRFNTNDNTLNDSTVMNGVRYTNPNNLGSLSFDNIDFDPSIPTAIMFFSIDGKIAKIDFPIELIGENFFVNYNGNRYNSKFVENENYASPTIITSMINNDVLELTYTKIDDIDLTDVVYHEMIISLDGINSVIEFSNDYLGATFNVWKDGKIGTGVFTKGLVTITL